MWRLAATVLVLWVTGSARAEWKIDQAPLKFRFELDQKPTHPSAGYVVRIPDGGIIPGQAPITVVHAENGERLESYALWYNQGTGLGLVFEAPKNGKRVDVYVGGGPQLRLWTPASGLTPSALLSVDPTRGSIAAAKQLAGLGAVGPSVHFRNHAGVKEAPLSVGGDLSGRSRPGSFYLLAHVETTDPGKTWIAPFTIDGETEVWVDGQAIVPEQRTDKWGGTGMYVALDEGLHRFEVFQSAGGEGPYKGGLSYFTWRTPKASMKELGGVRPKKAPHAGTSMMETRIINNKEVVRSGSAKLLDIVAQDGRPVPDIRLTPREVFWFANESPVLVYELKAGSTAVPGTKYTWTLGEGATVDGPELLWLVAGGRASQVSLTATAGGKSLRSTRPFFAHAPIKSNLNDRKTRSLFRKAMLNGLEAHPASADPTAKWTSAFWSNLFRCIDLDQDPALLNHIFRVRAEVFAAKVPPEKWQLLQEVFLETLPRESPDSAIKWTETLEQQTKDEQVKGLLHVRRAELFMYYKQDPDRARAILEPILRLRKTDEVSEWARIRYADIEFLAGDLNKATRLYGDVQNRAGHTVGKPERGSKPAGPAPLQGLATSKAEMEAQRAERLARMKAAETQTPDNAFDLAVVGNQRIPDWKINALVDAANSEKVKSLIQQGYLLEARQALKTWERNFPLSKISSDYVLNEARLYMALEDWSRAEAVLAAYCEQIDASSYIPPAVEALLTCKIKSNEPREPMIEFCEKMRKKLEFHPAVKRIDEILDQLKQ